jgi:hypothetical protein
MADDVTRDAERPDAVPDVVHDLTHWAAGQLAERPTRRELKDMVSVVLADRIQWRKRGFAGVAGPGRLDAESARCGGGVSAPGAAVGGVGAGESAVDAGTGRRPQPGQGGGGGGDPPLARLRTHLLAAAEALDEGGGGWCRVIGAPYAAVVADDGAEMEATLGELTDQVRAAKKTLQRPDG